MLIRCRVSWRLKRGILNRIGFHGETGFTCDPGQMRMQICVTLLNPKLCDMRELISNKQKIVVLKVID